MAHEIEIPIGDAIELTHNSTRTLLPGGTLRLLRGGEFELVVQDINAGQIVMDVGTHRLARRTRLAIERAFGHHMASQLHVILATPFAQHA